MEVYEFSTFFNSLLPNLVLWGTKKTIENLQTSLGYEQKNTSFAIYTF
jgi:hypothetical protein